MNLTQPAPAGLSIPKPTVTVDPLKKYTGYSEDDLLSCCAKLLRWAVTGAAPDLFQRISNSYQFRARLIPDFSIDDGVLSYEGDPDKYPVASVQADDETLYIYPGAYVASVSEREPLRVARFD